MITESITQVIADEMAKAIQPLRQELEELKAETPTACQKENEPDWESFDRAAAELNLIVKP